MSREGINIEEIMDLCRKADNPEKILEQYNCDEETKQEIYSNILRERRRARREKAKQREELSEEDKIELYLKTTDISEREQLLNEISEEGRLSLHNKMGGMKDKVDIIKTLSDNKKIDLLDKINIESFKTDILKSCSYEKRIEYLGQIKKKSNQREIVQTLIDEAEDNDKNIELLEITNNLDMKDMHKVVANKIDEEVLLGNLEKLDKQVIKNFRANGKFKIENINTKIEEFMIREGVDKDSLEEKIELFGELNKNNEEIGSTVNFDFLSRKNIEMLTEERFEQMACYPQIQELFLQINNDDKRIELFNKCLDNFTYNNGDSEWTRVTENLLNGFSSNEYEELLNSIKDTEDIDLDKLTKVVSASNVFEIKNIADLENYEKIKSNVCEAIMNGDDEKLKGFPKIENMSNIERKKFAVLEKIYGQDLETSQKLIDKYGRDIEKITVLDEDSVLCTEYIHNLKTILEAEDEKSLDDLYDIPIQLKENEIDLITIERQLKNVYAKEYTKDLFDIENAEKINEDDEFAMYNAGTDFKMIVTSVAAIHQNSPDNFKDDWNRNALASQGFCASYIRNDMLGTADIPHICYGFSEMSDDALMLSGAGDIYSDAKKMNATAAHSEEYLAPDTQINETRQYNEMVFKRMQNGERKQPDYIVVFKKNGQIPNLEKAKQAVRDFEGELPIVVVDVDECAKVEADKVKTMMNEYYETQNSEILFDIKQKIRNNSVANPEFVSDNPEIESFIKTTEEKDNKLEDKKIEKKSETTIKKERKIDEEEYAKCYDKVGEQEKQTATKKILQISKEIQKVMNKEVEAADGERE